MGEPRVTVILPVRNGRRWLAEALQSIVGQTFRQWECIIVDDGSTDGTGEIVDRHVAWDERFRVIHHTRPRGLPVSLNEGIFLARGGYVARTDVDDINLPERLEKQVEYLDANPDISVVGTWVDIIDAEGRVWGTMCPPECIDARALVRGNPVVHPSVMLRREAVCDVGGYDERLLRGQDYELWARLLIRGYKLRTIPERLVQYRWTAETYRKSKMPYRVAEARLVGRLVWKYRLLSEVPYVLKPLLMGVLPKKALWSIQRRRYIRSLIECSSGRGDERA